MTKIKVVQVGCGKLSKYILKYAYDNGWDILGAIDNNKNVIGLDIGEIINTEPKGVIVESVNNLERLLNEKKPDICIVATKNLLNDIKDILRIIVNKRVNVITTCEEAFFSSNSNPKVFKELDLLAKANGVTITGCGYQDVLFGNLVASIAGATHNMSKIKGFSLYNIENFEPIVAQTHGVGMTVAEFEQKVALLNNITESERNKLINDGKFVPNYMWNTVGWIADKLNLTITNMSQKCIPIVAEDDCYSNTLKMSISKDKVLGMSVVVTASTKEKIEIEAECVGRIYAINDFDKNEWTIFGEPDTTVTINNPNTVELTCANIINRIPDVIAANPGFISTSEMNVVKYI